MARKSADQIKASELNNRGYDLAESERWEEAIPYYEQAYAHDPKNVNVLTNLGNAMQALGKLDDALAWQEKALQVDSRNALAWANKAVILSRLGRREEAIGCYDRSLAIDPENRITWFSKGSALFLLGHNEEAIACFDHILQKIDYRMEQALGAKSEVLRAIGKTKEADQCIEELHALKTDGGRFSFGRTHQNLTIQGETIPVREMLAGFSSKLRERTGMPQITVYEAGSGIFGEPASFEYSNSFGYQVTLNLFTLLTTRGDIEGQLAAKIAQHAQANGIPPEPPPIPRTSTFVEKSLNFQPHHHNYKAIAADGKLLVVFYHDKETETPVVMRHLPPIGIVHYKFEKLHDFRALMKDAEQNCSAFLDLSFLGEDQLSQDTIRVFLREHKLYGFG